MFVSSYTAYRAEAPIALYAVSKTALVALSKALAEELGPAGIRVNCVAPGARPRPPGAAPRPPPGSVACLPGDASRIGPAAGPMRRARRACRSSQDFQFGVLCPVRHKRGALWARAVRQAQPFSSSTLATQPDRGRLARPRRHLIRARARARC